MHASDVLDFNFIIIYYLFRASSELLGLMLRIHDLIRLLSQSCEVAILSLFHKGGVWVAETLSKFARGPAARRWQSWNSWSENPHHHDTTSVSG